MSALTELPSWRALQAQTQECQNQTLAQLFEKEPDRKSQYSVKTSGLTFDYARTHVTSQTLERLSALAQERDLDAWRKRLFDGEKINNTENRAVLHTALRAQTDAPIFVDGVDVIPAVRAMQKRMASFVESVRGGTWRGATGQKITDVVNIGIGGSDLGPRLVVSALRGQADGPRVHFVANVDATDLLDVLAPLDPATTLFIVVSKTFTTQETLLNARSARQWLVSALGESAVASHFVAVSTNREVVESFGIRADTMLPLWDWVGGRYSLWSAVGVSIALSVGMDAFRALLAGAASMDAHFASAPFLQNAPVLLAMIGVWYRNFWHTPALAILPYSERLRDLPRYLQQLDMESNGKGVTREGLPVDYATGPIIFGECGSVGQHSFHQWLHQGPSMVLADFIGIKTDDRNQPEHQAVLLAHLQAQMEALAFGRQEDDPARTNPGNKPCLGLWLERLDPFSLGALLALYEHKVFVQGVIWGLNSFDQFGVELGKKLANERLKLK